MSSAVYRWKTFRAQAEQDSGVSQKVFGFSPESVFALRPECCSESARNPVRLHPGMLFALPRNTHAAGPKVPERRFGKERALYSDPTSRWRRTDSCALF
jgi:hypothetical protein